MISVNAVKTSEGWILQTADEYKDALAGPVESEADLRQLAEELQLHVIEPRARKQKPPKTGTVASLPVGTLFRIDDSWYRFLSHVHGNKQVLCEVVGEKRNVDIPANSEVTQISVLNLT